MQLTHPILIATGFYGLQVLTPNRGFLVIHLNSVTKSYGEGTARVDALRSISLDIEAGEFVSIMGPSGSGKSTLLNLLGALDAPTTGSISIAGSDIARLSDNELTLFRRRHIGLIFQFFNLLPTLNAVDNVMLPVMLERRPTSADWKRAHSLLEQVGLGERTRHRMYQLSGGQMQRVAVARALMLEPRFILADEPTGNLDSVTGEQILDLLRETSVQTGTTVVMVTHDRNAAQVADRIVSMKDGQIVQDERVKRALSGAAE